MKLPIPPTYSPMEARTAPKLPTGAQWHYEPKWDGFRCLAFRDGRTVDLRSRNATPLGRYFPEIAAALLRSGAGRLVLDGELVVPVRGELSFDALLDRMHPGAARVAELARQSPAAFIVFDLLVDATGEDLTRQPLSERRARLEALFARELAGIAALQLSPCTTDRDIAQAWLDGQVGTDGVVAKRRDCPYASGERTGMQKIKRMRTAECVVGGFRYASSGDVVGSLLLGLHDDNGLLHHCGFSSSFTAAEREAVTRTMRRYAGGVGFSGREPDAFSRWSDRSMEWVPVEPVLVCEVQYDHFSDERFRHGTKLLRWRPDKAPGECTFEQVRPARRSGAGARGKTTRKPRGATAA